MVFVDLAELPGLFDRYWLWSARNPALAWFRRADYHGDPSVPLDEAVRGLVEAHTGTRPRGPIRLLTHLRYFGHNFNPVSFYFVYDTLDSRVETIVAEITNTPWGERHAYVLAANGRVADERALTWRLDKRFHVSPFMPMNQQYLWQFSAPADTLGIHMQSRQDGEPVFDAVMRLRCEPISSATLARVLMRFPLMTLQVLVTIHWQALRLILKRTPFFAHP